MNHLSHLNFTVKGTDQFDYQNTSLSHTKKNNLCIRIVNKRKEDRHGQNQDYEDISIQYFSNIIAAAVIRFPKTIAYHSVPLTNCANADELKEQNVLKWISFEFCCHQVNKHKTSGSVVAKRPDFCMFTSLKTYRKCFAFNVNQHVDCSLPKMTVET